MPAAHVNDQTFEEMVLKSDKPVLVDFYAEWCGPCQMAAPIIDELAESQADKVLVVKVNVDESQETAAKYGVMSIPTMLVIKEGKEVERKVGFGGKAGLEALIESVV